MKIGTLFGYSSRILGGHLRLMPTKFTHAVAAKSNVRSGRPSWLRGQTKSAQSPTSGARWKTYGKVFNELTGADLIGKEGKEVLARDHARTDV